MDTGAYDVACIGILVADIIAKTVDEIPSRGTLGHIDSIAMYTGGCAMSASICLSKLGVKAAILGKIGADSLGMFLKNELTSHGVDIRGLVQDASTTTSASVVLSDSGGERTFLHCASSNDALCESDIDYDILRNSKIVFVAGTNLMRQYDGAQTATTLRKARDMGKVTMLDTAWDASGRWMDILRPCLPHLDYFVPSYEEAVQLSRKRRPRDIADVFYSHGVGKVVIKLGKDGCYLQDAPGVDGEIFPVFDGAVLDTTGAGDSFCAGFLYSIIKGKNLRDACIFANAVGTMCVGAIGATTGIKPADEVERFIAGHAQRR